MIEFNSVTKRFGSRTAVNGLSFVIDEGTTTMLIGPSGCGKTTTLRMINRLIDADGGSISINGKMVSSFNPVRLRRSIGYAIQETGLFPHLDVFSNIAAVPRLLGWKEDRIQERVAELLDLVTLDQSYARMYPLQLSGGEAQRVGLARALAANPDILLMDEPFGAIDPINRAKLHELFISIQNKIRKTIVFVTHDINEAIKLGTKIAVLEAGSLVQYDNTAHLLESPANEFVERLLGHDRKLKALILKRAGSYADGSGCGRVASGASPSEIARAVAASDEGCAMLIGPGSVLRGVYTLPSEGGAPLLNSSPLTIQESGDLQEALSLMVAAGESRIIVVSGQDVFRGILHLSDISNEISSPIPKNLGPAAGSGVPA